jgi:hypothetical protein
MQCERWHSEAFLEHSSALQTFINLVDKGSDHVRRLIEAFLARPKRNAEADDGPGLLLGVLDMAQDEEVAVEQSVFQGRLDPELDEAPEGLRVLDVRLRAGVDGSEQLLMVGVQGKDGEGALADCPQLLHCR